MAISELLTNLAYVKGSLINLDLDGDGISEGFTFKLRNPPVPLAGKVISLKVIVDGEEINNDLVTIVKDGRSMKGSEVDRNNPLTFEKGCESLWLILKEGGLEAGEHEVVLKFLLLGFGDIWVNFRFKDEVGYITGYEGAPSEGLGLSYPLVISSNRAYAVLSRSGDLSALWEWMGVRYDIGGLYIPPAKVIGPLKLSLVENYEVPLANLVRRFVHGPGCLIVLHEGEGVKIIRKVYMLPKEAYLIEEVLIKGRDVVLKIEGKGSPIPYGLLGLKPLMVKVSFDEGLKCLSFLSLPLNYYGFLAIRGGDIISYEVNGDSYFREATYEDPAFSINVKPKGELKLIISGGVGGAAQSLRRLLNSSAPSPLEPINYYTDRLNRSLTISGDDIDLVKAFDLAKLSLYYLYMNIPELGEGIAAGLPRFPTYWARDSAWALEAFIGLGEEGITRRALENFLNRVKEGEVPMVIGSPSFLHVTNYGSADSTLYYPSLIYEYVKATGDLSFLRRWYPKIKEMMEWGFKSDVDNDGLLEHKLSTSSPLFTLPDTTWMDHVDRRKSAIEVQALWYRALRSTAKLAKLMGDVKGWDKYLRESMRVRELLLSRYWNLRDGYFYDTIRPDGTPIFKVRPNALIPLVYRIVDEGKARLVLDRVLRELTTSWGVRTLSPKDPDYDPVSYHNGAVWPLVTGWAAIAAFNYGESELGYRYLKIMANRILLEGGMYAEVYRGDVPVPFNSCIVQAWSLATYILAFLRMLGLERDVIVNTLRLNPSLPSNLNLIKVNNLKVGDSKLTVIIDRPKGFVIVINESTKPLKVKVKGILREVGAMESYRFKL